jgi:hypothetical protein
MKRVEARLGTADRLMLGPRRAGREYGEQGADATRLTSPDTCPRTGR